MDKNQLIGWVLITGIVFGFFALNNQDQEETIDNKEETSNKKVDSNKSVNVSEQELPLQNIKLDTNSNVKDSILFEKSKSDLIIAHGIFAGSAKKENKEYIIEDNKIRLSISSNGAFVSKAILKDYSSYKDSKKNKKGELILFEGLGNEQNIKFRHKGLPQNTNNFEFVPDVNGLNVTEKQQSISFKLKASTGGYILYTYNVQKRNLDKMKNNKKKKSYNNIIDQIEKIRSKNNTNWMDILRIAFEHSPKEAAKVMSEIYNEDQKISLLAKKLREDVKKS